jgi:hypothetical protein
MAPGRRPRRAFRRAGRRRAPAWLSRAVLALALLAVAFAPVAGNVPGSPVATCQGTRCGQVTSSQRWVTRLAGSWAVGPGLAGTVPLSGQAYAAAGKDVAVVAGGLTVSAYRLSDGVPRWQEALSGFRPGFAVVSARVWPGVVTVGVAGLSSAARAEVVLDSRTGMPLRRYPAALFGGTVAASAAAATVVGASGVTSYDNRTGKVRWRRPADSRQAWRTDGASLYITESAGGYLRGKPVTGLQVIDLGTGAERTLGSPYANPFTGTLAEAVSGVVIFSSAAGVTAYSGGTGWLLWTLRGVVPQGADPGRGLAYFTSSSGALLGVDPLTGQVRRSVSGATAPGPGGLYVARGGVVLGLDSGAHGEAWGYSLAAGRVTWTAPGLPWPHYFADAGGIGGSAAWSGNVVVIAACQALAPPPAVPPATITPATAPEPSPAPAASALVTSPTAEPGVPGSPSPAATTAPSQPCAAPVLVALSL